MASEDGKRFSRRRWLGLGERQLALCLLFITPALFCSNMLTARATHDLFPPVALAFWRWFCTLLLLLPFTVTGLLEHRAAIRSEWRDLVILGALGMGVCGAFVYIAADTTTATNIGLIYAASPILIVVIAHFAYHENVSALQSLGIALSLAGVLIVICHGDLSLLAELRFAAGDISALAAMIAWAVYSIMLRHRPSAMPMMVRFAAITLGGLLVLLPFTIAEGLTGALPPLTLTSFATVGFLALVASFGAYQAYGLIQRSLGAGPTSLLMYLIPLYNSVLAFLILGETLQLYHLIGAAMVLPGIYLATRKAAG